MLDSLRTVKTNNLYFTDSISSNADHAVDENLLSNRQWDPHLVIKHNNYHYHLFDGMGRSHYDVYRLTGTNLFCLLTYHFGLPYVGIQLWELKDNCVRDMGEVFYQGQEVIESLGEKWYTLSSMYLAKLMLQWLE